MAQQTITYTPPLAYPDPSQAWVVPRSRSRTKSPVIRNQPLFPDARRILVDLPKIGNSDILSEFEDDATDATSHTTRSATSSVTSDGSLPQSPHPCRTASANWIYVNDSTNESENPAEYILSSFKDFTISEPNAQKELDLSLQISDAVLECISSNDDFRKEFASFTWVRALGEGGYAATVAVRETRKGVLCEDPRGKLLCLKVFVKSSVMDRDLLFGVQRELLAYQALASVDKRLGSAFIMELDGVLEDVDRVYFGMELMKYDLMAVLTEGKPGLKENRKRWAAQIAVGIDALHAIGIIHRDIKPENLLIDYRNNIRIADLGSAYISPERSRLVATGEYSHELLGTWPYIAPEVLEVEGQPKHRRKAYGTSIDYWALGCIIYEMETPGSPVLFETETDLNLYRRWKPEAVRGLSYVAGMLLPSDVESLVLGLVRLDPAQRYNIEDLRQHPYFKNSDGTTEFDDIETHALNRSSESPEVEGDEVARLDTPLVFRPAMTPSTGPMDPATFNNLCWINPRGYWAP
ncbi:hypothetical protein AX17_007048 [Amanita inopinata Kibby_2008]|nr:hypothetical protein AX17_007048 [Amanita inopinata Kibby_2008]